VKAYTKRSPVIRRSPDLHNNILNSSAMYIGSIFWAFVLYHFDQRYPYSTKIIDYVLGRVSEKPTFIEDLNSGSNMQIWLLVATALLTIFVLALKVVVNKRKNLSEEQSAQNIDIDDEGSDINDCSKKLGFIDEDSDAGSKDIS
jgi:hypothetical protein